MTLNSLQEILRFFFFQAPHIHPTKHLLSEHLLCAKHCAKLEQKYTTQYKSSKGNGFKL